MGIQIGNTEVKVNNALTTFLMRFASSLDIWSKDINAPYFSLSLSSPRVYFLTFLPLTIKTVFNWTTTLSHFILLCTYFNLIDVNVTAVVKARLNSCKSRVSECRWRMLVMREQKWGSALIRCLHWNMCVCVFYFYFSTVNWTPKVWRAEWKRGRASQSCWNIRSKVFK